MLKYQHKDAPSVKGAKSQHVNGGGYLKTLGKIAAMGFLISAGAAHAGQTANHGNGTERFTTDYVTIHNVWDSKAGRTIPGVQIVTNSGASTYVVSETPGLTLDMVNTQNGEDLAAWASSVAGKTINFVSPHASGPEAN